MTTQRHNLPINITFPHANSKQLANHLFIAAWQVWVKRYAGDEIAWQTFCLSRTHRLATLADQLARGHAFSLDVLCRHLVGPPYQNTMHASNQFMEVNQHLLEPCDAVSPHNRTVKGATLRHGHYTPLEAWNRLPDDEKAVLLKEALNLIDGQQVVSPRTAQTSVPSANKGRPNAAGSSFMPEPAEEWVKEDYLKAFVSWIDREPYERQLRRRFTGKVVTGWAARLEAYFWPDLETGYGASTRILAPFLEKARDLALALEANHGWHQQEQEKAVQLAMDIFSWGRVPQAKPSPKTVEAVFWSALTGKARPGAPMNSGWTKVAGFATAHLEDDAQRIPHVIWDSRVATSITWRLDQLLARNGVSNPRSLFPGIGTVAGRGGSRPRPLELAWPNGYGSWSSQYAGSELVLELRDVLNSHYVPMSLPDGSAGRWTVFGVGNVLFMDGY